MNVAQAARVSYSPAPIYQLKNKKNEWNIKEIATYSANGTASLCNFFTFLNGNFKWVSPFHDFFEKTSEILSKTALGVVGTIGSVDMWEKKNPFTLLGYVLLVPISILSSGYNSWVARGLSYGMCNFAMIVDRREVVDKDGEPIFDKNKNKQYLSGDFTDKGLLEGFKVTCNESIKMLSEIFKKPANLKKFSHSTLAASIFQMSGCIPGFFGYKNIEAGIRDVSSIIGDFALLLDKGKSNDTELKLTNINLKSPVVQSGLLWIATSFFDLLKRFPFIEERIENLTELTTCLDRTASIRFTQGLLDIKNT